MKTSTVYTLPAAFLLAVCLILPARADIMLYNGELSQDVTDNLGARSDLYNPGSAYALHAYNGANVSYTEQADNSLGDGSGTELNIVNNGGVDGILRYNLTQSYALKYVNNTGVNEDGFLNDLALNNTLLLDIVWDGSGTFANLIIGPNSNVPGASDTDYLVQSLTANTPTLISLDLFNNADFQQDINLYANDTVTVNPFYQLRIEVQTATGEAGTFDLDNIALVPEPSTFLLISLAGLGLLSFRRVRG